MRKGFFLSLILLMAFIIPTAVAQNETVLLDADFEDGTIPEGLSVNENWKIIQTEEGTNALRGVIGATAATDEDVSAEGYFSTSGDSWVDYAYEARVRIDEPTQIAFFFREGSQEDGFPSYAFYILPSTEEVFLSILMPEEDGTNIEDLADGSLSVPLNEWFTVRVEAEGTNLRAFVDDNLVLSANDSRLPSGNIGFLAFNRAIVELDYVRVSELASTPDTPATISLQNFDGPYQDAVAELEELGIIPTGGRLLFQENFVFARATGGYTPLARNSSVTNFVYTGELNADINGENTFCALMFRLDTSQGGNFGFSGVDNTGAALAFDLTNEVGVTGSTALDLSQENYFTIVGIDDTITVFVNGQLEINTSGFDTTGGAFGIGSLGQSNADCEASGVWVWNLD